MKKVSLVGTLRYLGGVLIAMQGILLALVAIFMLNNAYQEQWKEYGKTENAMTVYLEGMPEETENAVMQYLYQEADSNHLWMIRRDTSLMDDGSFSGYTFGVYGDMENNEVSFYFYGKNVLNREMLQALLQSEVEEATLGIEKGSVYCLGDIPRIRFGEQTVLKKLTELVAESGTVQGEYTLVGVDETERQKILTDLAELCQVSEKSLSKAMRGEEFDNGLKMTILLVFVLAQVLLNIVFFIIVTLQNLDKGGKLALLGWSSGAFCYELFHCFLWYAVTAVPILTMIGVIWSGWTAISFRYMSYFFSYAVWNLILIAVEIGISVVIQMSIRPLAAIRGRFPKKILYFLGIAAYIGVSIGIVFCGLYVDGPVQTISENAKLSDSWNVVSDYQILNNISVGEDASSFSGMSNELDQNLFDWYREIHQEKGVYLIKTTCYNNEILAFWKINQTYDTIPEHEFWYFTCSQSYLEQLGLNVDVEVLQAAERGTRVYLIPSGMTEQEKTTMKSWLTESSTRGIREGDIETVFNVNREIQFVEYSNRDTFFTWVTSTAEESVCTMPVIYLCTPENMTYFESESLRAIGLDGYLKFQNKDIAEKYLDSKLLAQFHLEDNHLIFTDVQQYIDGLQKELMQTIAWFGVVFLILTVILIGILMALAAIFRIANQEKLNVQKFLGYGFLDMYLKPIVLLCAVVIAEMVVMLRAQSKFGCVAILLLAFVQLIIFKTYMTKNEISNVRMAFKEE